MKLYEQKSSETYSCGICSREVKKGEYHHNHDSFINGKIWGLDALEKQRNTYMYRKRYIKDNPTTKKERKEYRA